MDAHFPNMETSAVWICILVEVACSLSLLYLMSLVGEVKWMGYYVDIILVVFTSLIINLFYVQSVLQPHSKKRKLGMELETAALVGGSVIYQSWEFMAYTYIYACMLRVGSKVMPPQFCDHVPINPVSCAPLLIYRGLCFYHCCRKLPLLWSLWSPRLSY